MIDINKDVRPFSGSKEKRNHLLKGDLLSVTSLQPKLDFQKPQLSTIVNLCADQQSNFGILLSPAVMRKAPS